MKLYHSPFAPVGKRWTGTQADARAANGGDKNYETVEVPDPKPARLVWLNEYEAKLHAECATADEIVSEVLAEEREKPAPAPKTEAVKAVAQSRDIGVVDIMNRTEIEHALWATDERGLALLEECIAERRKELATPEPAARDTVNPPVRRRRAPS